MEIELTCLRCGASLEAASAACDGCGMHVEKRCSECGQPVQAQFRFCPQCGHALHSNERRMALASSFARLREQMPPGLAEKVLATRGRIEGERKQVTVLFCDLVSSATIAEAMDPEDYRDLLDRYLAVVFDEVARAEGLVNQIAGDGVMALFGAPLAHEDAPVRAIQAALAIRAGVQALTDSARDGASGELETRIGINTGPVIVGTVGGDLKMDYTAIGDTTNLAARLQAMARPNAILVSEATHRLADGRFVFNPLGRLAVRGKTLPVVAYEVENVAEAAMPVPRREARSGPFVGRAPELERLRALHDEASRGRGQVVGIIAETGLGASSLAREFTRRAGARGVVLWGRCFSYTREVPYRPFVELLRGHLGLDASERDAARLAERVRAWDAAHARSVHALHRLLGLTSAAASAPGADEMPGAALEAVARLILDECGRAVVLLVLEDVQWMDGSSAEVLESLIERVHDARMVIVYTARPESIRPWRERPGVSEIHLGPLSRSESIEIVEAVVGGPPPDELVDAVIVRAEGNPYFTEEVSRALVEAGAVVATSGGLVVTRELTELEVPVTVHEIVAARLDRLAAEDKRVAQVASVVGRHFAADLLEELLAPDGIDVRARLLTLESAGIIRALGTTADDYVFGQGLTQEVAYQGLLHKQRRQLHEEIGHALERRHGPGPGEACALLAFHFRSAEKRDKAVHHLLGAAAHAESVPTYASAAELSRRAWELAREDVETDAQARQALSAGLRILGFAAVFGEGSEFAVERMASEMEALLERVGTSADRVASVTFLGLLRIMGAAEQFAAGLGQLAHALGLAEREGLHEWRSRVLRSLTLGYALDGRFEEAMHHADAALAEVAKTRSGTAISDAELWARASRDAVLLYRDDLASALEAARATHAAAESMHNRSVQVVSAGQIATIFLLRGEASEASAWAQRGLRVADVVRSRGGVPNLAAIAVLASTRGGAQLDVAAHLRRIEDDLGGAAGVQQSLRFAVDAFLAAGDVDRAERVAQRVRRRAGGRLRQAQSAIALAAIAVRRGESAWSRADYFFDEAERVAREIGARSVLATALLGRADLLARRGEADRGQPAIEEATGLCAQIGMRWGLAGGTPSRGVTA